MQTTLNQKSLLTRRLKEEKWVTVQFNEETIFSALGRMSEKQYKYILFLLNTHKPLKLREVLIQLGVQLR